MSHLELKGGILEVISRLEEKELLMRIYDFVKDVAVTDTESPLSAAQEKELDTAIEEADKGGEWVEHTEFLRTMKARR
jgi:hypothetical protein